MSGMQEIGKDYDVVVVGGGLSGVCAAIAAARHGAKTAIVQARPVFGGCASSEIKMHVCGAGCHMAKSNNAETGILMELLLENKKRNAYHAFPVWDTVLWEKVRFQEGLDSYLNASVSELEMDGGEIAAVRCYQSTTETAYKISGKIFIDATGHGTVGAMAGAESRMGSESKHEFGEPTAPEEANDYTMGNTLMFQAVNRGEPVKFEKPFWAYSFSEDDLKYRHHYTCTASMGENGEFAEFKDGEMKNLPEFSAMDAGYWWIELGGTYDNIVKNGEVIRDELLKCVYGVWDHIKNCGDHGAANYDLEWVGMVPGFRESRRLVGDYLLNENDVRANRVFPDAVAYGGWPMDGHVPGGIMAFDSLPSKIFNFDGVYTIPYRSYYSKNVGNLMMAGRDISATKMAMGSSRVMATCAVGGQAAGTAAAMAALKGLPPRAMGDRIGELQQALLKDDCYIPGFANRDPLDLARKAAVSATSWKPGMEPRNVVNGVARKVGADENCWESDGIRPEGEAISLRLERPAEVKEVRITFDPNLTREIMPSITAQVRDRQAKGMPEELVRDYSVELSLGGKIAASVPVEGNCQRLRAHALERPMLADTVTVRVRATHGSASARVFEIRVY